MFKKLIEIIECELKISRLQKEIRVLEAQHNTVELFKKRQELLEQLHLSFTHPFGFKDMKQLAITEIGNQLERMKLKPRNFSKKKIVAVEKEEVVE